MRSRTTHHAELRIALHRVANAAIDAIDAIDEDGIGDRYNATMDFLRPAVHRAMVSSTARAQAQEVRSW